MVMRTPDLSGRYNQKSGRDKYDRGGWKRRPAAPPIEHPRSLAPPGDKYVDWEKLLEDTPAPTWGGGEAPPPTANVPTPVPRPVGPRINPFVDPGTGLEPKGWYPGTLFNAPLSQFEQDQWPGMEAPKYNEADAGPFLDQNHITADFSEMTPGTREIDAEHLIQPVGLTQPQPVARALPPVGAQTPSGEPVQNPDSPYAPQERLWGGPLERGGGNRDENIQDQDLYRALRWFIQGV